MDLKILRDLGDRDLLNACLTNKRAQQICSDENFWRSRYYEKYGEDTASYKNPNRSWKQYYLLTLQYEEKYYPVKALEKAAENGHLDLVKYFESQGGLKDGLSHPLLEAATYSHKHIIDYLLSLREKHGYIDAISRHFLMDSITFGLARDGNRELLNTYIAMDPETSYNVSIVYGASKGGHADLVYEFDNPGLDYNVQAALVNAVYSGNRELVDYFLNILNRNDETDTTYNVMSAAAEGGHKDLLNFFAAAAEIPGWYGKALEGAAQGNQIEIAKELIDKMKTFIIPMFLYSYMNDALCSAARNGHKEMIRFLISQIPGGRANINRARGCAHSGGEKEIEMFLAQSAKKPVHTLAGMHRV